MKKVRLEKRARSEIREARAWYTQRSAEIGERFSARVEAALSRLESFPSTGGPVPGVDDPEVRRIPVPGFPYHVVFVDLGEQLQVLAIAHDRRRPGYWNV